MINTEKFTCSSVNSVMQKKNVLIGTKDYRVKISENANYHGEIINYVVAALLSLFSVHGSVSA